MGRWFGSASFASNCSARLPWSIYYIACWEECKKQYNTLPRCWVVLWTLCFLKVVLFCVYPSMKDVNIAFRTTNFWTDNMTISFSFLYFDLWCKPNISRGPIGCKCFPSKLGCRDWHEGKMSPGVQWMLPMKGRGSSRASRCQRLDLNIAWRNDTWLVMGANSEVLFIIVA